jgi:hypothetical protein
MTSKLGSRERENLRRAALQVLDANGGRFGLGIDGITMFTAGFGFSDLEASTLEPELEYLSDKGLIAEVDKTVSPENRAWKITANGRDFLARKAV